MKALIVGGASSGKSDLSQELACRLDKKPIYFATMLPCDEEDQKRIARHIKNREGMGFETLECPGHVAEKATQVSGRTVLFDSLTALLTNEMFLLKDKPQTREAILSGLLCLSQAARHIIFVSDQIFCDAALYSGQVEEYRQTLGWLHCCLAERCDLVAEAAAGRLLIYRGGEPFC